MREKYESRVVVGGETLINFEKFTAIYESIRQTLAFQSGPSITGRGNRESRLPDLLYLEDQLAATKLDLDEVDKMERRSYELQKAEEREVEEYHRRLVESTGLKSA